MPSLLLAFDPANDLILVKDQPAAGLEAEVRKPSGNEGLPYGPRRTADELGDSGDAERRPERRASRAGDGPWFAQKCARLAGPMGGPALARQGRRKGPCLRGFGRFGPRGLRCGSRASFYIWMRKFNGHDREELTWSE
jgi:hypothetical protein